MRSEKNGKEAEMVFSEEKINTIIQDLGVDLLGFADLKSLEGMPIGLPKGSADFLNGYRSAIVMGAQYRKLGKDTSGADLDLLLENVGLAVSSYLWRCGYHALTIHTEDEFDPINRIGLMSLKVLAKGAGLGWQGRSLLIVSPEYGPVHRWIAVLTNRYFKAGEPIPNQCGDCSRCVDKCPYDALSLVPFTDHPNRREDVLDVNLCRGDNSCTACIVVCPWLHGNASL